MILITGFTGNTGSLVLEKLLTIYKPEEIIGVSRIPMVNSTLGINIFNVDLTDSESIDKLFEKYQIKSIIHIANIRYSSNLLRKANEYKVDKVVLIHTTGVYSKYRSYSALYEKIEEEIMNKSFPNTNYIILRPTMIYGNERDHNMHKLIKFINKSPLFPLFGDGSSLMQPIHVEDLATATVSAHQSKELINEEFDLSGGSVVTYKEVITIIKNGLGKKLILISIPIKLAVLGAVLLAKISPKPIITVEQVKRLQEDKAYSHEKARRLLGFDPKSFNEGILDEIKILKDKGIIK